jgi:hypothetical protein
MAGRLRSHLTYANVTSTLALVVALTAGTAYAATQITGANIKDGTIKSADLQGQGGTASKAAVNGGVTTVDISGQAANPANGTRFVEGTITQWDVKDGGLTGADIASGSLTGADIASGSLGGAQLSDGSVTGADITDNSVGTDDVAPLHGDNDIQDNTITTFDLAENSVDSDEVLDFGLSNEDIGVLFAQINADGTVAGSSGSTTTLKLGTGQYEVDFGRNVTACAFLVTQGEAGFGSANRAIVAATDRSGNAEAAFVAVRDAAGTLLDRAFTVVAVC